MTSTAAFGAPGFAPRRLKGLGHRHGFAVRRLERYREPLDGLTDRQLLRRYMRYLRGADRAQAWVDEEATNNACGLLQQQMGRLHVAHQELRKRDLDPPSREEAYLHMRGVEVYARNRKTWEAAKGWPMEKLSEEMERAISRGMEDGGLGPVLHQRVEILAAQLAQRERMLGTRNGREHHRERLILANVAAHVANALNPKDPLHGPAQGYYRDRLWEALERWREAEEIPGDGWPITEETQAITQD